MKTQEQIKKEIDKLENLDFGLKKFIKYGFGNTEEHHVNRTFIKIKIEILRWTLR